MKRMKLKELQGLLQQVESFDKPNVKLEQYPTSPHIASHMLYTIANSYDELEGKCIADLGTGTGILGIGAQLLGSCYTIGIDIDPKALSLAQENAQTLEVENMEFIVCDIQQLSILSKPQISLTQIDTVIMNPPFGTKNKGIDMLFLKKATEIANTSVYSLHKTSTREHITKTVKAWGFEAEVLAQLNWDIPQMYKFHKKSSVDIDVDFIRINCEPKRENTKYN